VEHGERWRIDRTAPGAAQPGFIAVERATGRRIITGDPGELETRLMAEEQRRT
jgi:hypothetical protein